MFNNKEILNRLDQIITRLNALEAPKAPPRQTRQRGEKTLRECIITAMSNHQPMGFDRIVKESGKIYGRRAKYSSVSAIVSVLNKQGKIGRAHV